MSGSAVENTRQNLSPEELTVWLKECIAKHVELPVDEIQADMPFASYGLDSVYAFTVIADIEDHLGLRLDPTVMWDSPTLDGLVGAISEELRSRA